MSPLAMAVLLVVSLAAFAYSARRRWMLLRIGSPEPRFDNIPVRIRLTLRMAIGQQRMGRYPLAGLAHRAIFFGFLVLLVRSLILFGRGFSADPGFGYWLFDHGTLLGNVYGLIKDIYVLLVIVGCAVFAYLRVVVRPARMTLSREALVILGIILVMMIADILFDGAGRAISARAGAPANFSIWEPLGSLAAPIIAATPERLIHIIWHGGFWTHTCLVLLFLNILPYSKHFHIITAIPNVFFQDITPPGRLKPIHDIEDRLENEQTLGIRRPTDLSWKAVLDLYTCTECGRCTDKCPAAKTGKILSPKQLTVDLRDHLYETDLSDLKKTEDNDLVPSIINPEALWACTTCRACEQECPVAISYVDKIVDMRRHLVMERGEAPEPLEEAFGCMEAAGNPYGAPQSDRLAWATGLDVPVRAQSGPVDVLLWVGCAGAFDERARGVARAMAQLLNRAGVSWACLGEEERCTGDTARRAGNEYLFQMMAQANIELLDSYETKAIVTICPHCFNTLKNEYSDFGGNYQVEHHTTFLARLIDECKLPASSPLNAKAVYHDSCYLGRYNEVYDEPRNILKSIPGLEILEAKSSRDRGMCCGAGGAQMFKEEEEGTERVNTARSKQLTETGATVIATACPFCKRMLSDAAAEDGNTTEQLDIAELLMRSIEEAQTD